jgi:hypothetical protein
VEKKNGQSIQENQTLIASMLLVLAVMLMLGAFSFFMSEIGLSSLVIIVDALVIPICLFSSLLIWYRIYSPRGKSWKTALLVSTAFSFLYFIVDLIIYTVLFWFFEQMCLPRGVTVAICMAARCFLWVLSFFVATTRLSRGLNVRFSAHKKTQKNAIVFGLIVFIMFFAFVENTIINPLGSGFIDQHSILGLMKMGGIDLLAKGLNLFFWWLLAVSCVWRFKAVSPDNSSEIV